MEVMRGAGTVDIRRVDPLVIPESVTTDKLAPVEVTSRRDESTPPTSGSPGNTDWERFDNVVTMLLGAPKKAFVKAEKKQKKACEKKRAERKS